MRNALYVHLRRRIVVARASIGMEYVEDDANAERYLELMIKVGTAAWFGDI
jgi:hypothetical protein